MICQKLFQQHFPCQINHKNTKFNFNLQFLTLKIYHVMQHTMVQCSCIMNWKLILLNRRHCLIDLIEFEKFF